MDRKMKGEKLDGNLEKGFGMLRKDNQPQRARSLSLLPYSEFKQAIHDNILSCRKCEIICGDCEWSEICYINERKNKKLICWINEQDKILSFHQEEGFVQKEFTDRDELRCFLLAVYGIYRIQ